MIAPELLSIIADPAWQAMDSASRGFHIQLLIYAAQKRPGRALGTLNGRDPYIRKIIGAGRTLAAKRKIVTPEMAQAMLTTLYQGDPENIPENLTGQERDPIDAMWEDIWRPALLETWTVIDEELCEEHPELTKHIGDWFHPVARDLGQTRKPETATGTKNTAKTKARKTAAPAQTGEGLDLSAWHDEANSMQLWSRVPDAEERNTIWEVGVRELAGNGDSTDRSRARALISKLIRTHGETQVAAAIGNLAARIRKPANPSAFLVQLLKNQEEGSEAEQKARAQQADVAL